MYTGDKWLELNKLITKLERMEDLKFDTLMQILTEELGEEKSRELYVKARERFDKLL